MSPHDAAGHYGAKLQLYQCAACSGVWVDRDVAFALSRDSAINVESEAVLDDIATEPREVPLFCPRCEVYLTEQSGMDLPKGLHIDYCTTCRGFWFDKGELMVYKVFLEEKRTKGSQRIRQSETAKKQRQERMKQLERELESYRSSGEGYRSGMYLARSLLSLWRMLG
jgi:Zn-finger nucleic acid-binding protein